MANHVFSRNFPAFLHQNPIFVENLWKTSGKTLCKSIAKLSAKPSLPVFPRVKLPFSSNFSHLSHHLSHHPSSLSLTNLFHISTDPTIITTNNFIERI